MISSRCNRNLNNGPYSTGVKLPKWKCGEYKVPKTSKTQIKKILKRLQKKEIEEEVVKLEAIGTRIKRTLIKMAGNKFDTIIYTDLIVMLIISRITIIILPFGQDIW